MDLINLTGEQISRIECLVEHIGGINMCDPHSDVVDSSICQFMMYCLRDVLRYIGLNPSDARVPFMEHKLLVFKKQFYTE